ncbi:hypothetical protein KCU88_g2929, partial [Aureobasidium melanogenum]
MSLPKANVSFVIPSIHDDVELDCRLYYPRRTDGNVQSLGRAFAILAHPYAPLGGTYDDPVVGLAGSVLLQGASGSAGRTSWSGKAELADYVSVYGFMLCYIDALYRSQEEEAGCSDVSGTASTSTPPPLLVLGGYSYGAMVASHLPSIEVVADLFESPTAGSAESEIKLRALDLSRDANAYLTVHISSSTTLSPFGPGRGQRQEGQSPGRAVTAGGYESDAASRRVSRESSRRSVDGERFRQSMDKHSVDGKIEAPLHSCTPYGAFGPTVAAMDLKSMLNDSSTQRQPPPRLHTSHSFERTPASTPSYDAFADRTQSHQQPLAASDYRSPPNGSYFAAQSPRPQNSPPGVTPGVAGQLNYAQSPGPHGQIQTPREGLQPSLPFQSPFVPSPSGPQPPTPGSAHHYQTPSSATSNQPPYGAQPPFTAQSPREDLTSSNGSASAHAGSRTLSPQAQFHPPPAPATPLGPPSSYPRPSPYQHRPLSQVIAQVQAQTSIKREPVDHQTPNGQFQAQTGVPATPAQEEPPWEPSITNVVPYEDLSRKVCDWIYQMIGMANPPGGGAMFEIEAKVGSIVDESTGHRLSLPVETETLFSRDKFRGRTSFHSSMDMAQHRLLNTFLNNLVQESMRESQTSDRQVIGYDHPHEYDEFYELTEEGRRNLPPSIVTWLNPRHKPRVRRTIDETTGRVKAQIIKSRIADIDIYNPNSDFDYRISISIESPWEGGPHWLSEMTDGGRDRKKDPIQTDQRRNTNWKWKSAPNRSASNLQIYERGDLVGMKISFEDFSTMSGSCAAQELSTRYDEDRLLCLGLKHVYEESVCG